MDSIVPIRNDQVWYLKRGIIKTIKVVVSLAFFGVIYHVLWILRQHVTTILATIFGAIFLTTIILHPVLFPDKFFASKNANRMSDSTSASAHLPIVIHIVFDELMSPEAMSLRGHAGKDVAAMMKDFSEKFKFRLYGRVYSRHYFTADSLGTMFNFDATSLKSTLSGTQKTTKWANAYFDEMTKRGYEISVYQTAHLNFCAHPNVIVCEKSNSFNPVSPHVVYPEHNFFNRTKNLFTTVLFAYKDSILTWIIQYNLTRLIGLSPVRPHRFDVQAFPFWFEKISDEIIHAPRGTMIFAHILVPHAPYMLSSNCELNEQEHVPYDLGERFGFNEQTASMHKELYEHYFVQVECVFKKLTTLLNKMEESDRFKDATIIIHGDHSSRISLSHYLESMSPEDFIDNYPAFFATRGPGIEPGYDYRFVSLQELFAEYISPEPARRGENARDGLVVVQSKGPKEVVEVKMPVFGAAQCKDSLKC